MTIRDFEDDAAIVEAVRFLGDNGMFALVWLDVDLVVRRTLGGLASFVRTGAHVADSLLALIGQEDSIEALKSTAPMVPLTIPNVAMMAGPDAASRVRLNITLFWRSELAMYQVLLGRVLAQDLADQAVEDEIRKRRIADAELARVNRQLEDFAYVISHDLKAPLRALRYYSDDILEALAMDPPPLDVVGTSASSMAVATRRMGNMLTGLLEYARLGRQQEAIVSFEASTVADDIVASIGRPTEMRIVRTGTWPTIRCAIEPFDLVLRNLVDNAVKHHDRDAGLIELRANPVASHLIVEVIDDGLGIASEWHEAIFEPFRRIDDNRSPESCGIGLALVKRTVELAGGRIEVRSDPSKSRGTTFRVQWPLGL